VISFGDQIANLDHRLSFGGVNFSIEVDDDFCDRIVFISSTFNVYHFQRICHSSDAFLDLFCCNFFRYGTRKDKPGDSIGVNGLPGTERLSNKTDERFLPCFRQTVNGLARASFGRLPFFGQIAGFQQISQCFVYRRFSDAGSEPHF
jgi:hypothetical protein